MVAVSLPGAVQIAKKLWQIFRVEPQICWDDSRAAGKSEAQFAPVITAMLIGCLHLTHLSDSVE